MEKVFLVKELNSDDRDVVKYMTFDGFDCDHYFGGLHISGPCFSGFEDDLRKEVEENFDSLETILTQEEFIRLFELHDKLEKLGYDIKKDSKKYKEGLAIMQEFEDTIGKKLLSNENKALTEKVKQDEREYIINEYGLTPDDAKVLFDNYLNNEYWDRAIVSVVFNDFDEMVEEEKISFGYTDSPYFDNEAFGNDLLNESYYQELPSGKIVSYSY